MRRSSRLLRYGAPPRPGPANPPVVRASTILHDTVSGYRNTKRRREEDDAVLSYGRRGTTSAHALQAAIADLEAAEAAYLFPTGVAALAGAIQAFVGAGDHVLASDAVFSPTRKLFDQVMVRCGVEVSYFPPETRDLAALFRPNTRLLFLESPGSQTFEILDLPALTAQARERGVISMADNTYASGWLCQPIALGCDVSVVAGTKYLGGHADVMMGAAAANAAAAPKLRRHVLLTGQTLAPDESYNTLRGMRTLGLRLARHHETGIRLARWFAARPEVLRVLHPALESHPDHLIWKRDFSGAAGLFSVEFAEGFALDAFLDRLEFFAIGSSWGGFESLALPISPFGERHHAPSSANPLARFHAGLEDVMDLLEDLERAIATPGPMRGRAPA